MSTVFIPGWQAREECFNAISTQATVVSYQTWGDNAAAPESLGCWLDEAAQKIAPGSTLVGWSLGGMLACLLAEKVNAKQVNVIASSVKFSGTYGLEEATTQDFQRRYVKNANVTRKRFAQLVDRKHAANVAEYLLSGDHPNTLQWLYDIDLTNYLFHCPVHVLLAEDDQLVPIDGAKRGWQALNADVKVITGEHSLPIVKAEYVRKWLISTGVSV